jgi:cysteinyl-tRNA synthetase
MTYLKKRQAIPIDAPNFYQLLDAAWLEYAVFAKTKIIELDLARANKDFLLADRIRADLENEGVTVMTGKTHTDYFI